MLLSEILSGVRITQSNALPDTEISGISYDSRKTKPGDIFVAISGFETDGHKFIDSALKNGASVILCERKPESECSYVITDNSRYALAIASRNFYDDPASKMKTIGLTGTNGKTTTSYLIKHIIEETTGEKTGLVGTISNMIGDEVIPTEHTTPESLELNKLHRVLENLIAGIEIADLDVVTDRTPVPLGNQVLESTEFHRKVLEELTHCVLVLLKRQAHLAMRAGNVIVCIGLIQGVAPFEPAVIPAVPILEAIEQAVLNTHADPAFYQTIHTVGLGNIP